MLSVADVSKTFKQVNIHKATYLRLTNKKKRCAKKHRHCTEERCLEGQHSGVASSLLRLVFCGYYLINLPVEDL